MKPEQIFVGNIKRCTKYQEHTMFSFTISIGDQPLGTDSFGYTEIESEIHKENAVLIKLEQGGYVDLESLNSVLDYLKVYQEASQRIYRPRRLIMPTYAHKIDSLFVDEKTLQPYYKEKDKVKNISLRTLKRQVNNTK